MRPNLSVVVAGAAAVVVGVSLAGDRAVGHESLEGAGVVVNIPDLFLHTGESFGGGGDTLIVEPAGSGAGACCTADGCEDVLNEAECSALAGVFILGSDCASGACGVGACCDPDTQNCVNAPVYPCVINGRDHLGAGTDCADNPCALTDGACCLGDVCDVIPESECAAGGGTFFGFGTICFEDPCAFGACCLPGDCINTQKFECNAMENGIFVTGGDCDGPEDPCFVPNQCPFDSLYQQSPDAPDAFFWEGGSSEEASPFTRFDNFEGVLGPIETITWWGFDLEPIGGPNFLECIESDNTFSISFYKDAGGVPGEQVYSFTGVAERIPTGVDYIFAELNEYRVTLPTPAIITDGWISIVGMGDEDCWFLWLSSGGSQGSSFCNGCQSQLIDYNLNFCLGGTPGGASGACCDVASASCEDGVDIAECVAQGGVFTPNSTCEQLDPACGVVFGGCCFDQVGCEVLEEDECIAAGGEWAGPNTTCFFCPCFVPCEDPDAIMEGEVTCFDGYVDTYNGGCGSDPPVYQRLELGQTVCGTSGIFDTKFPDPVPDTDWYEVVLTEPTNLVWTVEAEFEPLVFIVDGNNGCPANALAGANVLQCQTIVLAANVQPGTYWLYISPTAFTDLSACGGRYTATVSGASACPGDLDGDSQIDSTDLNILLGNFGCDAGKGNCPGDIDGDGDTDSIDLNIILLNFGVFCPGQ